MFMRIAYLNLRKGRVIGQVALQDALRQKMDIMLIGEAVEKPGRTT